MYFLFLFWAVVFFSFVHRIVTITHTLNNFLNISFISSYVWYLKKNQNSFQFQILWTEHKNITYTHQKKHPTKQNFWLKLFAKQLFSSCVVVSLFFDSILCFFWLSPSCVEYHKKFVLQRKELNDTDESWKSLSSISSTTKKNAIWSRTFMLSIKYLLLTLIIGRIIDSLQSTRKRLSEHTHTWHSHDSNFKEFLKKKEKKSESKLSLVFLLFFFFDFPPSCHLSLDPLIKLPLTLLYML